ncbi:hypothetical protein LIER_08511 [Lithospermum erythrorhizon]|uniref:Uncharacterized protein n=1 Tax=Lithospermum erythrorhizon TaxID=34254 RepID=A0AAV3PCC4_LITER
MLLLEWSPISDDVDHDDYDYETENFMREDDFDYGTDVKLGNKDMGMENEDMDHEDSTGMERGHVTLTRMNLWKIWMQQLKNVVIEGYEALWRIDSMKWIRSAFRPATNYKTGE